MMIVLLLILLVPLHSFAVSLPEGCTFPDEVDLLPAYGPNDRVLPSLNRALCIINALQEKSVETRDEISACKTKELIAAGERKCIDIDFDAKIDVDSAVRISATSDDSQGSVVSDGIIGISPTKITACFFNTNAESAITIDACASGLPF